MLHRAREANELSPRAREAFASPDNDVLLSAASAWEIAVKHRLGKLPLLVAQALVGGLVLLTPDDPIRQYPVRTIW